jgi:hypothetical protein
MNTLYADNGKKCRENSALYVEIARLLIDIGAPDREIGAAFM